MRVDLNTVPPSSVSATLLYFITILLYPHSFFGGFLNLLYDILQQVEFEILRYFSFTEKSRGHGEECRLNF
jgi:hypothetical protein